MIADINAHSAPLPWLSPQAGSAAERNSSLERGPLGSGNSLFFFCKDKHRVRPAYSRVEEKHALALRSSDDEWRFQSAPLLGPLCLLAFAFWSRQNIKRNEPRPDSKTACGARREIFEGTFHGPEGPLFHRRAPLHCARISTPSSQSRARRGPRACGAGKAEGIADIAVLARNRRHRENRLKMRVGGT